MHLNLDADVVFLRKYTVTQFGKIRPKWNNEILYNDYDEVVVY